MEKITFWKTGTISLLILFLSSLGVNVARVADDQGYLPYACAKESVQDMLCYKLSKVNDKGIQTYCYFDRENAKRFKRCDTGWELLSPDNINMECNPIILAYTDEGKYYCEGIGENQKCVPTDDILSILG